MKKTIVILANNTPVVLFRFRRELIKSLLAEGFTVVVAAPYGEGTDDFVTMGCECVDIDVDRRGVNPIVDARLFYAYCQVLRRYSPDCVLTYTIKPNVFGGMACRLKNIPYISNITGLGTAVESGGLLRMISLLLYRIATKGVTCLFFQNTANKAFFEDNNIVLKNTQLIPGSGVNLAHYQPLDYPEDSVVSFVYVGRVMKAKGIVEYLAAAEQIHKIHPNTAFHVCGFCEEEYLDLLKTFQERGVITYHGNVSDVREVHKVSHCLINPSYHEGMSNVLLEAAASARPVLATDVPGCKEIVDEGESGFLFTPKSAERLAEAIEKFLTLSYQEKCDMGIKGREKIEREFDRNIVVNSYLQQIKNIL